MSDFLAMPKVEVHSHLDCSLRHDTVAKLGVTLGDEQYRQQFVAPERCRDLAEFLRCIDPALEVLQTEAALRVAVEGMLAEQARELVVYSEIRFAPHLHRARGLALEKIVETVLDEMHAASARHGTSCRLILCTLRHFSRTQSLEVADLVLRYANSGVVAIDLAGDEKNFPLEPHTAAFRQVREAGLNCIAHAGEAAGPESVRETLEALRPQRIGHGVRAIEDPDLVMHLAELQVHLEVCPSCNIQTGVFPRLQDHSLAPLLEAGVEMSLNTDARATTGVTLTEEYERVSTTFGWDSGQMRQFSQRALDASFAPDDLRRETQRKLDAHPGHQGPTGTPESTLESP